MSDDVQLPQLPGEIDEKYEADGAWFGHSPHPDSDQPIQHNQIDGYRHLLLDENGNGLQEVKVCGRSTKQYEKEAARIRNRSYRMPQQDRDTFRERQGRVLDAKLCVLDWKCTDVNGNPVPCTQEMAHAFLTLPRFRHHRDFIQIAIGTLQGDIASAAEEDRGNSRKRSAGSSRGTATTRTSEQG